MTTDYRALCARLVHELENTQKSLMYHQGCSTILDSITCTVVDRARAALAEPEPQAPTDEEIMGLMSQQMHEDLAAAARALAEQAGTDSRRATGIMRIILNRHAVDLARAVLARWGRQPAPDAPALPLPTGDDA
jgi:hypothetical protein